MPSSLIIFDCDGVLVDSERLGNRAFLRTVAPLGLRMELEEAMALFRGRKMTECLQEVERLLGSALPASFVDDLRKQQSAIFREELRPVEGIVEALDAIDPPICVASSGPLEKIELTLSLTGLLDRFAGAIFSAYEVGSWKPEPGLFLHAAAAHGVAPNRCIVVEDSVPGALGAAAAGMAVLGYAADGHQQELRAAGATVFTSMRELPALIQSIRQEQEENHADQRHQG
jgi:HAD superfamily hydrolase (TIGR01509 family)